MTSIKDLPTLCRDFSFMKDLKKLKIVSTPGGVLMWWTPFCLIGKAS